MENNIPTSISEFANYVEKLSDDELFNWAEACNKMREVGVFDRDSVYGSVSLKIRANSTKKPYYIMFDMCMMVADELMTRIANRTFDSVLYTKYCLDDLYGKKKD